MPRFPCTARGKTSIAESTSLVVGDLWHGQDLAPPKNAVCLKRVLSSTGYQLASVIGVRGPRGGELQSLLLRSIRVVLNPQVGSKGLNETVKSATLVGSLT